MKPKNELEAFKLIGKFLAAWGYHPKSIVEELRHEFSYSVESGVCLVRVDLDFSVEQIYVSATVPFEFAQEKVAVLMEYITRINHKQPISRYVMDIDERNIHCICSMSYAGFEFNAQLVDNVLQPVLSSIRKFLPGFLAIIKNDDVTAIRALEIAKEAFFSQLSKSSS